MDIIWLRSDENMFIWIIIRIIVIAIWLIVAIVNKKRINLKRFFVVGGVFGDIWGCYGWVKWVYIFWRKYR